MFHVQRLISRHFVEGLSAGQQARMRAHLQDCDACRREYNHTAELLRAAAGREPTQTELTQWSDALWQRLEGGAPSSVAKRGLLGHALMPALCCALLLLLCVGIWLAKPLRSAPEDQLRGASIGNHIAPLVTLEVFAIQPRPGGGFAPPRRLEEGDKVNLDTFIQIRYLNHDSRIRHLYLLGIDRRHAPLDYFPRPSGQQSITVGQALSPRAVPSSIRLARRHRAGPLSIIAIFSERPLRRAEVHRRLDGIRPDGKLGSINFGSGVHTVVQQLQLVD